MGLPLDGSRKTILEFKGTPFLGGGGDFKGHYNKGTPCFWGVAYFVRGP